MPPYSMIPFLALLVSAAFGAVSIAWDSERRATRSMGAIFGCTALWAGVELGASLESDPVRALAWQRWMHLPVLLLGPSLLWAFAEALPATRLRCLRLAAGGAFVGLILGIGAALVPGTIESLEPNGFGGWMPRYGPLSFALMPLATLLPGWAAIEAVELRRRRGLVRVERVRTAAFGAGIALTLVLVATTEVLLPVLEVGFPRCGPLLTAGTAALLWLRVLHVGDDLAITPSGVARALLAKLHDGVVLVDPEGVVLFVNARFAALSGRTQAELVGAPLADRLDASPEALRRGLEDAEARLRRADGDPLPVALTSAPVRNAAGGLVGLVVVVRDRREVDLLRAKLLGSGRLAAIGELAAGIAHEVNNPVAFVRSDLNLLARRLAELRGRLGTVPRREGDAIVFERAGERIASALEAIERVAEVVRDVREFAHAGGAGQGGSDPRAVVEGAMRLARLHRGDDVTLELERTIGSERLENGQELKQVLLGVLRVLVESVERGGAVAAELEVASGGLEIGLRAGPLREPASCLGRALFPRRPEDRREPEAHFGLTTAVELLDRLGGSMAVETPSERELRLALRLPVAGEGAS